jgi:hypothetical protein
LLAEVTLALGERFAPGASEPMRLTEVAAA